MYCSFLFYTLLSLLVGCKTVKKATHNSGAVRFLENISIAGNRSSTSNKEGIDKSKWWIYKHQYNDGGGYADDKKAEDGGSGNTAGAAGTKYRQKYAAIMAVAAEQLTDEPLYAFIDKWYGTTYKLGGYSEAGIDCSGFTRKLYEAVYGMDIVHSSMELYSTCERYKNISQAKQGDLVFFKTLGSHISHVGVYLTNLYFVHASTSSGVRINRLDEEYYKKTYAGCGHVKGMGE